MGVYFCKQKSIAVAKNGKEYASIILQDKTGVVDGKIWDLGSAAIREFEAMDFIDLKADVTVFNNAIQLNIKEIRKADEGTYDETDYMPSSTRDIEEMYSELMECIRHNVKNEHLLKLARKFFAEDKEFVREFKKHSAAKRVHHGFMGGLLEHTLGVTKLCVNIANNYEFVNKDLLVTAALFHDIGKVYELSDFPENDYTDEGQLIGHIVMGCEILGKAIDTIEGFPKVLEK